MLLCSIAHQQYEEKMMSSVYMTEVEQIEMIKTWWKRHHRVIIISLSIILLLTSGARYWQWHQEKRTEDASNAYEHLMVAFSSKDSESIQAYAQQLVTHYSGTVYADTARLLQAKLALSEDDLVQAKAKLKEVAAQSKFAILADVARIRLARILLHEKEYAAALQELDAVKSTNYVALQSELRGDIYYAQGKFQQAHQAYQLAKTDIEKSGINNLFLEMKQQNVQVALHSSTPVHTAHALS